MVFDDSFPTIPYMDKREVPPNWADLFKKSTEKVTNEDYDLARMWLFPDVENGNIAMQETYNNLPRSLAGKGSNNVVPTMLPSGQHLRPQNETDFSRSIDATRISQKDSIPSPYLNSAIASETDNRHTAPLQIEDN
jgi:hypothetical protein